jgi:uncharacterized protein YukE
MEQRLEKQEKDLGEFVDRLAQPKDFSSDIQRIDGRLEQIDEIMDGSVEPVNQKLEEFRDWAQESQQAQLKTEAQLQELEKRITEIAARIAPEGDQDIATAVTSNSRRTVANTKAVQAAQKRLSAVETKVRDQTSQLVGLLRKTLPKLKKAAVEEIKPTVAALESRVAALEKTVQGAGGASSASAAQGTAKNIEALWVRMREIENILESQQGSLLEMGTKLHHMQQALGVDGEA